MDPISGIGIAGGTMSGRMTFYVAVQLASVLLPGVVVLTEFMILTAHLVQHDGADLPFLVHFLGGIQGAGLAVFLAVGIGGSGLLGYLSRDLSFAALGVVERVIGRFRSTTAETDAWRRAERLLGAETVATFTALHPVLSDTPGATTDELPGPKRIGGGHRNDSRFEVFAYSKLWLRRCSPILNVDALEAEINILVATIVPTIVLAVDTLVIDGVPLYVRIAAVPVAALVCALVMRSCLRLRRTEVWESLRNLLFDWSMRVASAQYPKPENPVQDS